MVDSYIRAIGIIYDVGCTDELKNSSFLHYKELRYRQKEFLGSVRLVGGLVERLLFKETKDDIEVELIEVDSTRYGSKK